MLMICASGLPKYCDCGWAAELIVTEVSQNPGVACASLLAVRKSLMS